MPRKPLRNRKSPRLQGFDYSQPGAYFITICTRERQCLFGHIDGTVLHLSDRGRLVHTTWVEMPEFYEGLMLDYFVLMPNHLHAIVMLTGLALPSLTSTNGRAQGPSPTLGLQDIVHRFKSLTTARVRGHSLQAHHYHPRRPLWQRGYYEHVIRNDGSLERIREYIANNPAQWSLDRENPDFIPPATTPSDTEPWMV